MSSKCPGLGTGFPDSVPAQKNEPLQYFLKALPGIKAPSFSFMVKLAGRLNVSPCALIYEALRLYQSTEYFKHND